MPYMHTYIYIYVYIVSATLVFLPYHLKKKKKNQNSLEELAHKNELTTICLVFVFLIFFELLQIVNDA